jgi:hypothetical protein
LNESEPLDDVSKLTFTRLRTVCEPVTRDKGREQQFIGCLGLRHLDGKTYAWAYLRNRRTYPLVLREDAENL